MSDIPSTQVSTGERRLDPTEAAVGDSGHPAEPAGSGADAPPRAQPDDLPKSERGRGMSRLAVALPEAAFAAMMRGTQKPTRPSRTIVPAALVTRERVGREAEDTVGVPVTWLDRPRATTAAIVHLHGGAYVTAEGPRHWAWLEEVRRRSRSAAAMVHYRMPPRFPFPVAVDESVAVIRELVDRADLREGRWVLSGDSAGGGLALAVAQRLRDEGLPLPAGLMLTSPWTDLTLTDPMVARNAQTDLSATPEFMERCARLYAGRWALDDPRVSPRFAPVAGLPPVLLVAGGDEMLVGDARALAEDLRAAHVPVAYAEIPGGQHDHPVNAEGPAAQWAVRRQIVFVREACGIRD